MNRRGIIVFLLLCVAAFFYRPGSESLLAGDVLLIAAIVLCLFTAFPMTIPAYRALVPDHFPQVKHRPPRVVAFFTGCGLLVYLGLFNGYLRGDIQVPDISPSIQMLMLVGAVLLIGYALAVHPAKSTTTPHSWDRLLPIVLVLLLAFALRVIALDSAIRSLVDESHMVSAIVDLRQHEEIRILSPFNVTAAFTWVYPYAEMLTSSLVGSNLLGLRLVSAIVGTLSVAAVYLLGCALFNRRTALFAALILATFPPHLHFSRLALLAVTDSLLGTLALYGVIRAVQTRSRRYAALAGVCIGLLPYFADGAKLLFPVLIGGWLLFTIFTERKWLTLKMIVWLLIPAVVLAAPVIYRGIQYHEPFFARLEERAVEISLQDVLLSPDGFNLFGKYYTQRIQPPLLHFIHLPDTSTIFYVGDTGLILPLVFPLFILGLLLAIKRLRGPGLLLLLWIVLTVMGNSLIEQNSWTPRYVVAFPAMALVIAWGMNGLAAWIGRYQRQISIALVTGIVLIQAVYYFAIHIAAFRNQSPLWKDFYDVAFRTIDLPPEVEVVMIYIDIAIPHEVRTLFDYAGHHREFFMVQGEYLPFEAVQAFPPGADYAFFMDPEDQHNLRWLRCVYDLHDPLPSPYNVPEGKQYALYRVGPSDRLPVIDETECAP